MKKMMCIFVLLAFVSSTIIMTGCGSSGGGFAGLLAAGLIISAIASGGTAIPTFAASTRASTYQDTATYTADIYFNINGSSNDKVRKNLKVEISNDSKTLRLKEYKVKDIEFLQNDKVEYKVVFRLATATEGLTVIEVVDLAPGTKEYKTEADPETTAKALVYQQWKDKLEASDSNYQEFESLATDSTIFTTVKDAIKTDLIAVMKGEKVNFDTAAKNSINTAAGNVPTPKLDPATPGLEGIYTFTDDDDEEIHIFVKKSISPTDKDTYSIAISGVEDDVIVLYDDQFVISGNKIRLEFESGDGIIEAVMEVGSDSTFTAKTRKSNDTVEHDEYPVTKLDKQHTVANTKNDHIQGLYIGTIDEGTEGISDLSIYLERGEANTNIYVITKEKKTITTAKFDDEVDEPHTILTFKGVSGTSDTYEATINFAPHDDVISMRINTSDDEIWVQNMKKEF